MKPGPPPKPTALITSWRAKKRKGEPRPPQGKPTCPGWLTADAKRKWREVVKHLEGMGLLTKVDGDAITMYAHLFCWLRRCLEFITKHGESYPLYADDAKKVVVGFRLFPQVNLSLKLAIQVARLEAELGLTPSGRARLQVNTEPEVAKVSTRPRFDFSDICAPENAR